MLIIIIILILICSVAVVVYIKSNDVLTTLVTTTPVIVTPSGVTNIGPSTSLIKSVTRSTDNTPEYTTNIPVSIDGVITQIGDPYVTVTKITPADSNVEVVTTTPVVLTLNTSVPPKTIVTNSGDPVSVIISKTPATSTNPEITTTTPVTYNGSIITPIGPAVVTTVKVTPIDCNVSEWSSSLCNAQCGETGTQTQTRKIVVKLPGSGTETCPALMQTIECQADACSVATDCVMSDWGEYSPCDATECGTSGNKVRVRTILTEASNGGLACGPLTETTSCNSDDCPPTDCVMSSYEKYGECVGANGAPLPCGRSGQQTYKRTVISEPTYGGLPCGSRSMELPCNTDPCPVPVDCIMSEWQDTSICSGANNTVLECNAPGTKTQQRTVITTPTNGGVACGPSNRTIACSGPPCPNAINCAVSEWTPYSACNNVGCGTTGKQSRSRTILTYPMYGGTQCPQLSESIDCIGEPCPAPEDCVMGDWTPLTPCRGPNDAVLACGTTGTQTQTRKVLSFPKYGGAQCGSTTNTLPCQAPACPPPDACSIGEVVLPSQWKKYVYTPTMGVPKVLCTAPNGSPGAVNIKLNPCPGFPINCVSPPGVYDIPAIGYDFTDFSAVNANDWITSWYPPPNYQLPSGNDLIGLWVSRPSPKDYGENSYYTVPGTYFELSAYNPATREVTGRFIQYYNSAGFMSTPKYTYAYTNITGSLSQSNVLTIIVTTIGGNNVATYSAKFNHPKIMDFTVNTRYTIGTNVTISSAVISYAKN
jgi:hypothetical protein